MPDETLRPISDFLIEWPFSTGGPDHYEDVDEPIPDEDTTYIRGSITDDASDNDIFNLQDLALDPAFWPFVTVNHVTVYVRARSEADPWPAGIRTILRTHGTNYVGAIQTPPITYTLYSTQYINNPFTGAPWTVEEVNALRAGIRTWSYEHCIIHCTIYAYFPARCTQVYVVVNYTVPPVLREQWPYYMAFAKRAFKFHFNFDQPTADNEVSELIDEFVLRGLNRAVLEQLAAIAKTKGELAKQED